MTQKVSTKHYFYCPLSNNNDKDQIDKLLKNVNHKKDIDKMYYRIVQDLQH